MDLIAGLPLRHRWFWLEALAVVLTAVIPRVVVLPPTPLDPLVTAMGIVLYVLGYTVAIWARIALGRSWGYPGKHDASVQTVLITNGPYAWCRHPMYVGLILLALGFAIALRSGGVIFVVLFTIVIRQAAMREEMLLEEYFGVEYIAYVGRVRAGL